MVVGKKILHERRIVELRLAFSAILLLVSAGCAVRDSGQQELFLISPDDSGGLHRPQGIVATDSDEDGVIERKTLTGDFGDFICFNDDVLTVQVDSVYLADVPRSILGARDVVLFCEVWENAAEGYQAEPLNSIIFIARDQQVPGRLNFSGNLAYGPTTFKGHPLKIRFTLMVLRRSLLSGDSQAGRTLQVIDNFQKATRLTGAASGLGSEAVSVIREILRAQPDVIAFDYEHTFLSVAPEGLTGTILSPNSGFSNQFNLSVAGADASAVNMLMKLKRGQARGNRTLSDLADSFTVLKQISSGSKGADPALAQLVTRWDALEGSIKSATAVLRGCKARTEQIVKDLELDAWQTKANGIDQAMDGKETLDDEKLKTCVADLLQLSNNLDRPLRRRSNGLVPKEDEQLTSKEKEWLSSPDGSSERADSRKELVTLARVFSTSVVRAKLAEANTLFANVQAAGGKLRMVVPVSASDDLPSITPTAFANVVRELVGMLNAPGGLEAALEETNVRPNEALKGAPAEIDKYAGELDQGIDTIVEGWNPVSGSTTRPVGLAFAPVLPVLTNPFDRRNGWLRYGRYAVIETQKRGEETPVAYPEAVPDLKYSSGWLYRSKSNTRLNANYLVFSITPRQPSQQDAILLAASKGAKESLDKVLNRDSANVNQAIANVETLANDMFVKLVNSSANQMAYEVGKGFRDPKTNFAEFEAAYRAEFKKYRDSLNLSPVTKDRAGMHQDDFVAMENQILRRWQAKFSAIEQWQREISKHTLVTDTSTKESSRPAQAQASDVGP